MLPYNVGKCLSLVKDVVFKNLNNDYLQCTETFIVCQRVM